MTGFLPFGMRCVSLNRKSGCCMEKWSLLFGKQSDLGHYGGRLSCFMASLSGAVRAPLVWAGLNGEHAISWRLMLVTYLAALVPLIFPFTKAGADVVLSIVALLYAGELVFYERERFWHRYYAFFVAFFAYLALPAFLKTSMSGQAIFSALFYSRFFLFFGALVCWIGPLVPCRRLVFWATGLSLLLVTLDGLYQHFFDVSLSGQPRFERRLTSFFRRPLLGFFLTTLVWPVALFYVRQRSALRVKLLSAVALSVVVVFLTGDRAISALMALSVLWIGGVSVYYHPRYRLRIMVVMMLTSVGGFLYSCTQPLLIGRLRVLFLELASFTTTSYGQLFKAALFVWQDHPFFGIGYKGFTAANVGLYDQGVVTYLGIHSHNYYLAFMAELGLVGLVFLLVFVMVLTKRVLSGGFWMKALGGAALIVIFWPFTTTMDFFSSSTAIVTWLSLGLLCAKMTAFQDD